MSEHLQTAGAGTKAVAELRASFRGAVIEPGQNGYDETRLGFNGMFDRRPAVVLRPSDVPDVIRAVGFARTSNLPLAIRGGGHSVAGFNSCDGGVVVDMSAMKAIRVDADRRTATAQAGVLWGEFDAATQEVGLATTGGRVTNTGVVGFTLGSGSGWLERKLGFACDSLVRAELVTADGEVVTATESENEELFWALHGGGGNFGIVTELEFRLSPVGPIVFGGLAAFDPAQTDELIRIWRDVSQSADDDLGWGLATVTAPPAEFVPEAWHGKRVAAVLGMHAGGEEAGREALAPLRALKPIFDLWQLMPYTVVQGLIDPSNPFGRRNYWRAHNLTDLDDETIAVYCQQADKIASPFTAFILLNEGGAVARVPEDATVLGGRAAPFNVHLNCMWEDAADDAASIAWVKETTDAFGSKIMPGMGLNFHTEVGSGDMQATFGAAKVERLREVKTQYDPTNLFRLNQNVTPA